MSNISLTPELAQLTRDLAAAVASSQKVIAAKARIGLFYQNADATDLFRKVNEYGEKLRNKSMEGMPPSEEEIAKFDSLRQAVVDNDLCKGFLDSRQELDEMLSVINQYLVLAINKGEAPSDAEVAEAMTQEVSACSCGGGCHGDCDDCSNEECSGKEHEGECCGGHGHHHGEGECCGGHGHHHGEGECRCGRH